MDFLLVGSGLIDEKGYYIGTDEDGRAIILDTFIKSSDRPNSNITISGASGSGKSYLAKKIMLNEWLNGAKLYILDPESECKNMCKAIGGSWIDCSGGKGKNVGRINPLQVNKLPNNIEDENYSSTKSALALHMDFLTAFFKLYFPEITSFQMSLLMEILEELYKSFNIDYETDIEKIPKEQFPIMEDLYYLLEKKIESSNTKHREEIEVIKSIVRSLAIGHNAEIFNGYTTIEDTSDFLCLDIYSLQGASSNIKSCQYLNMLRYCEDMAFKNREEKCYVVCDEAYLLLEKVLSDEGMSFGNSIKYKLDNNLIAISQTTKVIKENFIKVKQTVSIGIAGVERHIGATTLAINLTKYLSELTNVRACYIENNNHASIINLVTNKDAIRSEAMNKISYKGMDLFIKPKNMSDILSNNYNFYIYNYGAFNEMTDEERMSFLTRDLKVLVSGNKQWELPNLIDTFEIIGMDINTYLVFNFTKESERENFRNSLGEYWKERTTFSEYVPEPFEVKNKYFFENIVKPYLINTDLTEKKKKFNIFRRRGKK